MPREVYLPGQSAGILVIEIVSDPLKLAAPPSGAVVAAAALQRSQFHSREYAKENAPTSPNPNLTGNTEPGVTLLTWLKGRYKCNQFVGDVLTESGFSVPSFTMHDGSQHYVNAEQLPKYMNFFDRVGTADDLGIGDLVVIDGPSPGEDGAHVEVVTAVDDEGLRVTGAHSDGAYEREYPSLLDNASFQQQGGYWLKDGSKIYLLRPKKFL